MSSQLTATVSVTLVLFVLGLLALTGIAAHNASTAIKEQIGFVVIMDESATDNQIDAMRRYWEESERVSAVKYASPEEVLSRWNSEMGIANADGDDDLLDGINPFLPEFEVNVKARYASADSLEATVMPVRGMAGVKEIKFNADTARSVTSAVESVLIVMALIAAALLIISLALINNTIRLAIYSRRFMIHTMRLVGATASFIRAPFVRNCLVSGLGAAAIAIAALGGAVMWAQSAEPELNELLPLPALAYTAAGMLIAGAAICSLAAILATNRYIRLRYDELFS